MAAPFPAGQARALLRRDIARSDPPCFGSPSCPGPRRAWGEVVAAFVRPAPGQPAPATEELRAHCREHLAPYKTPVHWVFVDAFPMTLSGKIQKYKLRDSVAQQQPT